ncbi:hypothetical protein AB5I41_27670 [Sphingomonas sp. MMS24-JH45]
MAGTSGRTASARTVTADRIDTRITFDAPDPFVPRDLPGVAMDGDALTVTVPARSVTTATLR